MTLKRWKDKRTLKIIIKFCLFVTIASLPFISITQKIGLETFLDSFENSEYYFCFQDEEGLYGAYTKDNEYVIVQGSRHPDFTVSKDDFIIYSTDKDEIVCNRVYRIRSIGTIKKYQTLDQKSFSQYVLENQVLGRVVKVVDNNLWNSISITLWEISINSLNIRAILTE